jgi:hypothetical protein
MYMCRRKMMPWLCGAGGSRKEGEWEVGTRMQCGTSFRGLSPESFWDLEEGMRWQSCKEVDLGTF